MSVICARLGSKGKVGVQRGRETAGVPSFLPSAVGAARSRRPQTANLPAEVQRKTPRPSGSNTLTQFAHPGFPVQKRSRPSGANPPAAVRVPRSAGAAKGAARQGRTRLRQFACPAQPVQQKEPPVRGEPACGSSCALASQCSKRSRPDRSNPPAAVRVPWSPCAEKRKAPQNCFHGAQSMHFYSKRSSVSTSLRAGACGSCAG